MTDALREDGHDRRQTARLTIETGHSEDGRVVAVAGSGRVAARLRGRRRLPA